MAKRNNRISILYQDRDLIALNKPPGILSVPLKDGRSRNLLELLNEYLLSSKCKAGIVHRIDRYTSGVVLFAKRPKARTELVRQFRARSPRRIYLALIYGQLKNPQGELRHYLKLTTRSFSQVISNRKDPDAAEAVLRYRLLEQFSSAALVEVELVSGLKNQIRAQFAAIGHPLVGDQQYPGHGRKTEDIPLDRQALHAHILGFQHPSTSEFIEVEAPLPKDLKQLLQSLRTADTVR